MQSENISAIKSHASILIEHLQRYGITLKKTQALEVVSNLHAQTDWNRVSAKLKTLGKSSASIQNKPSQPLPTCFLIGRPGVGKTEVLKTIVQLESADKSALPVLVCLSGSAHIDGHSIDRRLPALNRWTVHYDEQGLTHVDSPDALSDSGKMINFVSLIRGGRLGLKEAFVQFMREYAEQMSCGKIGSFIIDEFARLPKEDELDVINAAVRFCAGQPVPVRQLLIASQTPPILASRAAGITPRFVVEMHYPVVMPADIPVETVMHFNTRNFEPEWLSESASDPRLVSDIYARVLKEIFSEDRMDRGSKGSRMSRILGNSLWFRDLRNSLI